MLYFCCRGPDCAAACRRVFLWKIRDYRSDALVAGVLSQPRLWPSSPNEDVVANNGILSVQRQRELKETKGERQTEAEW